MTPTTTTTAPTATPFRIRILLPESRLEELLVEAALGKDSLCLLAEGVPSEVARGIEELLGVPPEEWLDEVGDQIEVPWAALGAAWPRVLAERLAVRETRCAGYRDGHSVWAYGPIVRPGEEGSPGEHCACRLPPIAPLPGARRRP